MRNFLAILQNIGLSEKGASVYLAALELGEATVQELARWSHVKRTTIYYTLTELLERGALKETKRNRRIYYIAEPPSTLLKNAKEYLSDFEESLGKLEELRHTVYKRPRLTFFYGPAGFKEIWNMIFESKEKEFMIITSGENFLDFVKEKYILDDIIRTKKKLGVRSRQIIVDSPYARKIIAKDMQENRVSKLLPPGGKLPFTEIICSDFVAFISSRLENNLFVVENESFAQSRQTVFETLWQKL